MVRRISLLETLLLYGTLPRAQLPLRPPVSARRRKTSRPRLHIRVRHHKPSARHISQEGFEGVKA